MGKKLFPFKTVTFAIWLSIMLLTGICTAQDSSFNKTDFGVQFSVNRSYISKYRDIYDPRLSAGLQLFAMRNFHPSFSFSGGVGFTGMRYSRQANDSNLVFDQLTNEFYAELPLNIWFWPDKTTRFWAIYAGITPSALLIKNVDVEEIVYSVPKDPSVSGRVDLAMQVGAKIHITPRVYLGAAYSHSFTSNQRKEYNEGRFSYGSFSIGVNINPPKKEEEEKVEVPTAPPLKREQMYVLVRLRSDIKKIERLNNSGYADEAEKLRVKTKEENDSIVQAFKKSLNICQAYFFYDTSSKLVLEGRYQEALFDYEGNQVNHELPDTNQVFIAEFGSPYSTAFQSSSGYGLVVFNHRFEQMEEPFPFYTSNMFGLVSKEEVIRKFNNRLADLIGAK